MERKVNNVNVAELLMQLKELKKKKARNVKMLKKLKRHVSNEKFSPKRDEDVSNHNGLECPSKQIPEETSEHKHIPVDENTNNLNCSHLKCKVCDLPSLSSKLPLCTCIKTHSQSENVKDKENCSHTSNYPIVKSNCMSDISSSQNALEKHLSHLKEENAKCFRSMKDLEEGDLDKSNSMGTSCSIHCPKSGCGSIFHKRQSSFECWEMCKKMDNDCKKKSKHNSESDINGANKVLIVDKITSAQNKEVITKESNFSVHEAFDKSFSEDEYTSPKIIVLKTYPDCIENDMTCFLSSEMLDICYDEGKVEESVCKTSNYTLPINEETCDFESCSVKKEYINSSSKTDSELCASIVNISPILGNPNFIDLQQKNYTISNFSKFSTSSEATANPTKIVLDQTFAGKKSKDMEKIESNEESKSHIIVKELSEMDRPIIKKYGLSVDKENSNQSLYTQEYNQTELKCILGSNLSSALDAHYGSPSKKLTSKCICPDYIDASKSIQCQCTVISKDEAENIIQFHDINGLNVSNKSQPLTNVSGSSSYNCAISPTPLLCINNMEDIDNHTEKKLLLNHESIEYVKSQLTDLTENAVKFDEIISSSRTVTEFNEKCDSSLNIMSHEHHELLSNILPEASIMNSNTASLLTIKTADQVLAKDCEDLYGEEPSEEVIKPQKINVSYTSCDSKFDSEILIIPETEGLRTILGKGSETIHTSPNKYRFRNNHEILNNSSINVDSVGVSKIVVTSPDNKVPDIIEETTKLCGTIELINDSLSDQDICNFNYNEPLLERLAESKNVASCLDHIYVNEFKNMNVDSSWQKNDSVILESGSIGLFIEGENMPVASKVHTNTDFDEDENLNFSCCLHSETQEPVTDVELILFNNSNYLFIQHITQIQVWIKQKNKEWAKIFHHQIDCMQHIEKMVFSKADNYLVLVIHLSNEQEHCLQFLLFESETEIIKLMEHMNSLKNKQSWECVLLCGLDGFMFATAQGKSNFDVFLHVFHNLKDNPKLISSELGSTVNPLCSLCKADKLPNALIGISKSELYVWHLVEVRLVTVVSLSPHDYLPIKNCFWATVEKGLIFFLTSCEDENGCHASQLLAANLATGFCQTVMTYSLQPAGENKESTNKMTKVSYCEPYIASSCQGGAFLWCVTEKYCCAALEEMTGATTITIGKSLENWGLVAVGLNTGCVSCYTIK